MSTVWLLPKKPYWLSVNPRHAGQANDVVGVTHVNPTTYGAHPIISARAVRIYDGRLSAARRFDNPRCAGLLRQQVGQRPQVPIIPDMRGTHPDSLGAGLCQPIIPDMRGTLNAPCGHGCPVPIIPDMRGTPGWRATVGQSLPIIPDMRGTRGKALPEAGISPIIPDMRGTQPIRGVRVFEQPIIPDMRGTLLPKKTC